MALSQRYNLIFMSCADKREIFQARNEIIVAFSMTSTFGRLALLTSRSNWLFVGEAKNEISSTSSWPLNNGLLIVPTQKNHINWLIDSVSATTESETACAFSYWQIVSNQQLASQYCTSKSRFFFSLFVIKHFILASSSWKWLIYNINSQQRLNNADGWQ